MTVGWMAVDSFVSAQVLNVSLSTGEVLATEGW